MRILYLIFLLPAHVFASERPTLIAIDIIHYNHSSCIKLIPFEKQSSLTLIIKPETALERSLFDFKTTISLNYERLETLNHIEVFDDYFQVYFDKLKRHDWIQFCYDAPFYNGIGLSPFIEVQSTTIENQSFKIKGGSVKRIGNRKVEQIKQ